MQAGGLLLLYYESIHSSGHDVFRCFVAHNIECGAHFHRAYEMAFVQQGAISAVLGEKSYTLRKGACILLLPDEIHAYQPCGDEASCIVVCIFSSDFVEGVNAMAKGKSLENPVFFIDERARGYLLDTLLSPDATHLQRKACLYVACAEALRGTALVERDGAEQTLLYKIMTYVQNNFAQNVTLRDVAYQFGYDYSYLSRYLNKYLHMSFSDFLNNCRVSRAAELLRDQTMRISEISRVCGYDSTRTFNRNFMRIYKQTPREYRATLL